MPGHGLAFISNACLLLFSGVSVRVYVREHLFCWEVILKYFEYIYDDLELRSVSRVKKFFR